MKLALMFPGQGSQYLGMGKKWFDQYEVARQTYKESDEILGFSLSNLIFDGTDEELTLTENAQPAILTTSIAAYRIFQEEGGPTPDFLAGHSLGEFTALVAGGAITFEQAVRLVRIRGQLMSESNVVGAMIAITGAEADQVRSVCREYSTQDKVSVISNYNTSKQVVVSGHQWSVDQVERVLKAHGAEVVRLKVSAPFHSPLMEDAAAKFKEELKKIHYKNLTIPVISNVYARPYVNKDSIPDILGRQIVEPVQWYETMKYLSTKDINMVVELGPKKVLKNMFKEHPSIRAYSYDFEDDVKLFSLAYTPESIEPNTALMKLISRCLAIAVCTRNQNWDNEAYTKGVLEPYRRVKEMEERFESSGTTPTLEDAKVAIGMLQSIFETKLTPLDEREERFNQLLEETKIGRFYPDLLKTDETVALT